jgi:hypothetical protein
MQLSLNMPVDLIVPLLLARETREIFANDDPISVACFAASPSLAEICALV